jgi:DNA-binding MarR family transcriptional regulator
MPRRKRALDDDDYARLLSFRDGLRRFLRWSEGQAQAVGLTGPQHQLLLAIRGHGGAPSVGDVAAHLRLRHHSAVGLVDRAVGAGLVERTSDPDDQRVVRLHLTSEGEEKLGALAAAHMEELTRLRGWLELL